MFLIFTKSDCISSKKIIEYVKDGNQTYKEVNTSLECLNDHHIKLLSSIKGKSFLNFLRPKSNYFNENNLDYNSLNENVLLNIMKFNLKDTGSFPIILFLSYSGKVKNCMIGINEEILDSWIENESIENVFIDCNKPYGTEECCWLDKKQKILDEIKSRNLNSENEKQKLLNVDNSNLFNLKKINDKLIGKESTYNQFDELKNDDNNLNKNKDIFKKYIDARNKIIDNDNKHKNSFDFFEIENKNKSFLEQLENEKDIFLSENNNLEEESFCDDLYLIKEKNNESEENLTFGIDDYNQDINFEDINTDKNENLSISDDPYNDFNNENIDSNVDILNTNEKINKTDDIQEEFIEINFNEDEKTINNYNLTNNDYVDNDNFINTRDNDDFINTNDEIILDDNKELDYSLSNEETVVEESLISDYINDDEYVDNNQNLNNDENIINDELNNKSSDDEFIQPIYIDNEYENKNNLLDENLENRQNDDIKNTHEDVNEFIDLKKEDLDNNIENNSNNNDEDDFITVDLSEDPFFENVSPNYNQDNNDFVEVQNDGEGLEIFEINEQTQHINNNTKDNKNYLNISNKVIDEYDEWINKYELTENEIAHQKAIENEK